MWNSPTHFPTISEGLAQRAAEGEGLYPHKMEYRWNPSEQDLPWMIVLVRISRPSTWESSSPAILRMGHVVHALASHELFLWARDRTCRAVK